MSLTKKKRESSSARIRHPNANHVPNVAQRDLQSGPTAARRFYDVIDLRRNVLGRLSHEDLARWMTVDRKGLSLVAEKLYHTVPYEVVEGLAECSQRHRVYYDSVREISIDNIVLSQAHLKQLEVAVPRLHSKADRKRFLRPWTERYHPAVFNLMVPPLIRKCAGLRVICFESEITGEQWSVKLDETARSEQVIRVASGVITVRESRDFYDRSPPPSPLLAVPIAPSAAFRVILKADVCMYRSVEPLQQAAWLVEMRKEDFGRRLQDDLDVGNLTVTLDDLCYFCQQQEIAEGDDHLKQIKAINAASFDISTFERFSRAASSHLSLLCIAKFYPGDSRVGITFADLPFLVRLVREHMPGLRVLELAIKGIETAEVDILPALQEEDLLGGRLERLRIHASCNMQHMCNVLRSAVAMCSPSASVFIGHSPEGTMELPYSEAQMSMLRYLLSQPEAIRRQLAIVDFADLDVWHPEAVKYLTYDDQGRPRPLHTEKAHGWSQTAHQAANSFALLVPQLLEASDEFRRAADDYKHGANHSVSDRLELAQQLSVAAARLERLQRGIHAVPTSASEIQACVDGFSNSGT